MNLRKQDLVNMWDELSTGYSAEFKKQILVPTGRGGQYASRDYIYANCILSELAKRVEYQGDFNKLDMKKKEDIKKWLHPATLFRLSGYSPCLAFRYDELKPQEQKRIFEDRRVVMTKKENGVRGWLIHAQNKTFFYSRNYSQKDCSLPEYWDNVLQSYTGSEELWAIDVECKWEAGLDLTQILGEYGVSTDSKLEAMSALLQMNAPQARDIQKEYWERFGKDLITFRLITPLFWKGVNYKKRTLGEGFAKEQEIVDHLKANGVNVQRIEKVIGSREEKEIQLATWIDKENEEGAVFHFLDSFYNTSDNRKRDVFVKLKRTVGDAARKAGMGDTIDGWVSGFKLGSKGTANEELVSALEVTVNLVKDDKTKYEHVIAWVPNIELELKKSITTTDFDGNIILDPAFYGTVVEVEGQAISAVSRRLTHPRLIRLRFDKLPEDCVYSESFIMSQIDTNN